MPNDVTKEHAEWLGLIETEGPFLSLPVLLEEFPQGLNRIDSGERKALRLAHEAWLEDPSDPRKHVNWIEQVLRGLLEHTLREPSNWDTADWYLERFDGEHPVPESLTFHKLEHGETVQPKFVIRNPDEGPGSEQARMLVIVYDRNQSLTGAVSCSSWKDRPATRAAELCRSCGVQLALVTNGHQWMVVDAPPNHTLGTAMWRSELFFDEPITLQAFYSLFGQVRFFSVEDSATPEQLLNRSRKDQYEVTDQLGYQVRQAIEILVGCLQRADRDLGGSLLQDVPPDRVYEASVSIMMRLIVLLCAEERDLLQLGEALYDDYYAVSTLGSQLREVADEYGETILEAREDAWSRLLALFRMVHSGVGHDRLSIAAYGGSIFDPDRFPFLEGRAPGTSWQVDEAKPLPIDNRTVLHILDSIQWLQISIGGEKFPRKLSFKALGIEQIGHVYESLLDHNAVRADEPVLGLFGKQGEEPEVKLSSLEGWVAKGGNALANELKKLGVGSSAPVVKRKLEAEIDESRLDKIHGLCDAADATLWDRVKPFVGVIRDDTFGHPIVVPTGGVFVTQGTDRRSSGSHYTTRDLTEPIVERTLEPQVFVGPAEGHEQAEWTLKSPAELLDLKILDPACGSGAFLVQSCRYLADRLVESWAQAIDATGGHIDIEGRALSGRTGEVVVPEDDGERTHLAQRLIVQRCLYGVDKNHLAVEMAKLSLWLLILAKDEPFTFLDHAVKCGDSLVGLTASQIKGLDWKSQAKSLFSEIDEAASEASKRRGEIVGLGVGHEDEKALLHRSAEAALEDAKLVGDVVIAAFFKGKKDKERREYREEARSLIERWRSGKAERTAVEKVAAELEKGEHPLSPFHWELEFPEVFGRENSGFDAVVGNPPFLGGRNLTAAQGAKYSQWLVETQAESSAAADLVARFFRLGFGLLRDRGVWGLIATNTIAQGDSRNTGLRWICTNGGDLFNVTKRVKWPGAAAVMVSLVHGVRGEWSGERLLDGSSVPVITAFLFHAGSHGDPLQLGCNAGKSFVGSYVLGMGFTFDDTDKKGVANSIADMDRLIAEDPKNQEVIFPYIGGSEINSSPTHAHHRFVINLGERTEGECRTNWPDVMEILEAKVKPERSQKDGEKYPRMVYEWWKYWNARPALYSAIAELDRVLAVARVGNHCAIASLPSRMVHSEQLIVFPYEEWSALAALQSRPHEIWARFFGSSMKDDLRYTPSDCFETFPFPKNWETDPTLEAAGQAYYEYRADLMVEHDEGLTKTYNRFHDPEEKDPRILKLRELHAAMDRAVLDAYGWDDISTDCEFIADYEVEEGKKIPWRYRWPEAVHDEVLARLLELNQQRYEAEVAQGLHTKTTSKKTTKKSAKKKAKKKAKADTADAGLFES